MRPVTRKMYVFKFPNDGQKYTGRTGESVYEVILGISWPTFKKVYTEENLPDEIKLAMGMIDASNADITSRTLMGTL